VCVCVVALIYFGFSFLSAFLFSWRIILVCSRWCWSLFGVLGSNVVLKSWLFFLRYAVKLSAPSLSTFGGFFFFWALHLHLRCLWPGGLFRSFLVFEQLDMSALPVSIRIIC
jgi:hypothetical protein